MDKITTFNIPFSKISASPIYFEMEKCGVQFSGNLVKNGMKKVLCNGKIIGFTPHNCDRCGQDIKLEICESLELILSDGVFEDFNHEVTDAIEFFDGEIDIDEIFQSEIEAYKSGYFYCNECKNL